MPAKPKAVVRSGADWASIIVAVLQEAGVESAAARLPRLLAGAERRTGRRLGLAVAAAAEALRPPPPLQLPQDVLRAVFGFLPLLGYAAEPGAELVCRAWHCEARWHLFRHLRTDAVHTTRVAAYLLQATMAGVRPLSVHLRLGPQQWMVLPWLLTSLDVSELQRVHLSDWKGWLPMWHRNMTQLPPPLRDAVHPLVIDVDNRRSWHLKRSAARSAEVERQVIEALDRLPVLRELSLLIRICNPRLVCQALARWSLTSLACDGDLLCGVPSPLGLHTLTCSFTDARQAEECLLRLPHLRSLTVVEPSVYTQMAEPLRLISRSLEHVSMTRAGKDAYISYLQCPQLKLVQGQGDGYGNGFLVYPSMDVERLAEEGLVPRNGEGPGVYTQAGGYAFCYLSPSSDYYHHHLIEFGEGGEVAEDCRWELVGY